MHFVAFLGVSSSLQVPFEPFGKAFFPVRASQKNPARRGFSCAGLLLPPALTSFRRVGTSGPLGLLAGVGRLGRDGAVGAHHLSLGDDLAVDAGDGLEDAETELGADELAFDHELIAGLHDLLEAGLVDACEVEERVLAVRAFGKAGERDDRAGLGHRLDDQNAGHDGHAGEVSRELRLVGSDVLERNHAAGLRVEFDDAVDNTYDLNDDVAIHMYGQSIARDTYTNGLKIDGLTSSAVQSAVPGKGVEPIVVEDISQLSQYENRLVTLRDVEFVLPYGTLCNINEAVAAYGIEQPAKYQRSADYNDLTLEYGHYLRDGKGRLAKLYTSWSFTERGLHLIPEGAGDITGIVNKRYKADRYRPYSAVRQKEESWCIRVRRESDITNFSASDATRHSKTVMQIGPWSLNKTALPEIVASVGKGRLKHSVGVTVKGSTTGTTDEMYWAWAHVRNGAATFDAGNDRWLPAYGNATTVQYTAVMAQNWWKNTAAQYSSTDGCCWILTDLSTVGYTGALSIAFTASSNTIGPIEFQMEWADREDAAEWTPIGTPYVCANWHCDIHAPEYVFPLPDELKDRENFCIRLRATIQRNASDDADVANGTSRIGIVRISCLN